MSWSISVPRCKAAEFEANAKNALAAITNPNEVNPSRDEQAAAVIAAAVAMLPVVCPDGHEVSATLSGHSNPGHVPAVGWGNDCVTIHMYQQTG